MDILDLRGAGPRLLDRLDAGTAPVTAALLSPGVPLVTLGARAWRWLRRPPALPFPPLTIAVGNRRVGGTGKTPVVANLAGRWAARGVPVAIVSRGYRGEGGGDEPEWLRVTARVQVVVDPDRRRGTDAAAAAGATVVFLDDALQSPVRAAITLAIELDRDLVHPLRVLPAGPAREGPRALRRAQALLFRVESDPWPVTPPQLDRYERAAGHLCGGGAYPFRLAAQELRDVGGRPVERPRRPLLVSGLARPASFEASCRALGLRAVAAVRFDDHWRPRPPDLDRLNERIRQLGADRVVCPEKNLVRLADQELAAPLAAVHARIEWARDPLPRLRRYLG